MGDGYFLFLFQRMGEGVEEEVGIGDTNMLDIVLVELVGAFSVQ